MGSESLEQRLSRAEILDILRHPDRIQADEVVQHMLKEVRYADDLVAILTGDGHEGNLEARMRKMGMIGGEGTYVWDAKHTERVVFAGQLKPRGEDQQSQAEVNYGYVSPEGLMFANLLYRKAEAEGKKLLLLVNTFGGAANNDAALKGQSWLILFMPCLIMIKVSLPKQKGMRIRQRNII